MSEPDRPRDPCDLAVALATQTLALKALAVLAEQQGEHGLAIRFHQIGAEAYAAAGRLVPQLSQRLAETGSITLPPP